MDECVIQSLMCLQVFIGRHIGWQYMHAHRECSIKAGEVSKQTLLMTEAFPDAYGYVMSEQVKQVGITHLFLLPQCKETNARHLHNLEANTGDITLGFTTTTETRDENFVVLVNKV